jgi:hypothetical protein
MPQSHDTLSGHGLIRGGSAQLGFLLGEFDAEAFRSERFRSCDEWMFGVPTSRFYVHLPNDRSKSVNECIGLLSPIEVVEVHGYQ